MPATFHAWGAVNKAVRLGELPPVSTQVCADCGDPAQAYDHRDYRKPLEVDPVCDFRDAENFPGTDRRKAAKAKAA